MSSQGAKNLVKALESKGKTAKNRRKRLKKKTKRKEGKIGQSIKQEIRLGEEMAKIKSLPSGLKHKQVSRGLTASRRTLMPHQLISEDMVMGMILAPRQNIPCRFSDKFTSEETAVARPWQIYDAPWDTSNAQNADLPFYVFRDPLRAAIQYDYNLAGTACTYLATISDLNDSISQDPTFEFNSTGDLNAYVPVNIIQFDALTSYQPHGPVFYPGRDNVGNSMARFVWLETANVLSINPITSPTTGQTAGIRFPHWDGGKIDYPSPPIAWGPATGTILFSPSAPGYYGVEIAPTNFNGGSTLTLKAEFEWKNGNAACYQQLALPNLNELISSMEGITVLAASMMYTQTSSDLNNAGEIVGVQIRKEDMWYDNITFATVKARNNAVVMNAKKGMYGFLRPASFDDFKASNSYVVENGILVQAGFPLQPLTDFICIIPHVGQATNRSGEITLAYAIEYKTSNTMLDVSNMRCVPEVFESAVLKTAKMTQWHENPTHLKDIANFIKNVASKVVEYGPQAMNLAKVIGTFF